LNFGLGNLVLAEIRLSVLGQKTTTAHAIPSVPSNPEVMDATVFDVSINRSPVHFEQPRSVSDWQKWMMILAERTPDFLSRKQTRRAERYARCREMGGH